MKQEKRSKICYGQQFFGYVRAAFKVLPSILLR